MRMMNELKHLFLYSANKKVYVPIDEQDKRKNSAILLLTPDLSTSTSLMNLPYLYNPNLFTSFYIDRNVMAYIDNSDENDIEFDEQEEKIISENMVHYTGDIKIKFDDHTSIMDEKYIREVFNKNAIKYYAKMLRIMKVPERIDIVVHPSLKDLQENAPSYVKNICKSNFYSYWENDKLHLISKMVYDPESMFGPYTMYLTIELIQLLMISSNNKLAYIPTRSIAYSIAGLEGYMKKETNNIIEKDDIVKFAHTVSIITNKNGYKPIIEYIKSGDVNVFAKYTVRNAIKAVNRLIFESELSYFDRQRLLPSDFGIPNKRKYPIHDEDHVRAAIRMFNNCDPDDEEELAKSIIKRINRFGLTNIKVGASNRFRKYYKPEKVKTESFIDTNDEYEMITQICNNLSNDELRRITFTDTYENSKFVIKRVIAKMNGIPVGFLDVYHFPSNPTIAQIVIAVDGNYRGRGIANYLVEKMMEAKIHETNNFDMYYWTAHTDNIASQNLAMKHGFIDTNELDSYGRKIFIKRVNQSDNIRKEIPLLSASNEAGYVYDGNSIITENAAIFFEADDPKYSQKLRRYLYKERLKNNKAVLTLYDDVKAATPYARKTYLKIKMYKKLNVFIDLSYYHALFLKNNIYKLDKAVNFYFDFLNRLINNKEIDAEYSKKTIFIPIDPNIWPVVPGSELYDFKKNLNPISIIFRLIRTNPGALRKAWGDKDIVFVGSRGYFTIDFNKFEIKDLARLRVNLRKLTSINEPIKDDYESDDVANDDSKDIHSISTVNSDTSKAMAAKMIDRIESSTAVKINNVSSIGSKQSNRENGDFIQSPHLRIVSGSLDINKKSIEDNNGIIIISIDPDGPEGFERFNKTTLSGIGNSIDTYCIP